MHTDASGYGFLLFFGSGDAAAGGGLVFLGAQAVIGHEISPGHRRTYFVLDLDTARR